MQYFETPRKKRYINPTTSTTNHYAQHIDSISVSLFNLHTTEKLSPVGKYYIYNILMVNLPRHPSVLNLG